MDKYQTFREFGKPKMFMNCVEIIDFSKEVKIIYDLASNQMKLVRQINFGDFIIKVLQIENGELTVYSDNFYFSVKDRKDGYYKIQTDTTCSIDFCVRNKILTLNDNITTFEFTVDINPQIKLNFNDLSESITNFFQKSCAGEIKQPHGIMFVDLDIEMI